MSVRKGKGIIPLTSLAPLGETVYNPMSVSNTRILSSSKKSQSNIARNKGFTSASKSRGLNTYGTVAGPASRQIRTNIVARGAQFRNAWKRNNERTREARRTRQNPTEKNIANTELIKHIKAYTGYTTINKRDIYPSVEPYKVPINPINYRFKIMKNPVDIKSFFLGITEPRKITYIFDNNKMYELFNLLIDEDILIDILYLYTFLNKSNINSNKITIKNPQTQEITERTYSFFDKQRVLFFVDLLEYQFYLYNLIFKKISTTIGTPYSWVAINYEIIAKIIYIFDNDLYTFIKNNFGTDGSRSTIASGSTGYLSTPAEINGKSIYVKNRSSYTELFTCPNKDNSIDEFRSKFKNVYNTILAINLSNINNSDLILDTILDAVERSDISSDILSKFIDEYQKHSDLKYKVPINDRFGDTNTSYFVPSTTNPPTNFTNLSLEELQNNLIPENILVQILNLYTQLRARNINIQKVPPDFKSKKEVRFFIDLLEYQFYIYYLILTKLSEIIENNGTRVVTDSVSLSNPDIFVKIAKIIYIYDYNLYNSLRTKFGTDPQIQREENKLDTYITLQRPDHPVATSNRSIFIKSYDTLNGSIRKEKLFQFDNTCPSALSFKNKFIYVYNILRAINKTSMYEDDEFITRIRRFMRTPQEKEEERRRITANEEERRRIAANEEERRRIATNEEERRRIAANEGKIENKKNIRTKLQERLQETRKQKELKEGETTNDKRISNPIYSKLNPIYSKIRNKQNSLKILTQIELYYQKYQNNNNSFKINTSHRKNNKPFFKSNNNNNNNNNNNISPQKLIENEELLIPILKLYTELNINERNLDPNNSNTIINPNQKYQNNNQKLIQYFTNAKRFFIHLLEYQFYIYILIMKKISETNSSIPFNTSREGEPTFYKNLAKVIYLLNPDFFNLIKDNFTINSDNSSIVIKSNNNEIFLLPPDTEPNYKLKFVNVVKCIAAIETDFNNSNNDLNKIRNILSQPPFVPATPAIVESLQVPLTSSLPSEPHFKVNYNTINIIIGTYLESLSGTNLNNIDENSQKEIQETFIALPSNASNPLEPNHDLAEAILIITQEPNINDFYSYYQNNKKALLNILHIIYFFLEYFLFAKYDANSSLVDVYKINFNNNNEVRLRIAYDLLNSYNIIFNGIMTNPTSTSMSTSMSTQNYFPQIIQDYKTNINKDDATRSNNIIYALNKSFYINVQDYIDYLMETGAVKSNEIQNIGPIRDINQLRFNMYQNFIAYGLVNEADMESFVNSAIPNFIKNNRKNTSAVLQKIVNKIKQTSIYLKPNITDPAIAKYRAFINNLNKVGHRNIIRKRLSKNRSTIQKILANSSIKEFNRMHQNLLNILQTKYRKYL